ncbi:hypothetical protein [Escherichia albertii]|nr:hypothetical protein [Escherichia albertii]
MLFRSLPLLLVALSPVAHSEGVKDVESDEKIGGWNKEDGEDDNL